MPPTTTAVPNMPPWVGVQATALPAPSTTEKLVVLPAKDRLAAGFAAGDLDFNCYSHRITTSRMGRKLWLLGVAARRFYGARPRFWFGLARQSTRAQKIGMNWYNGVGYHGGAGGLAALVRA